MEKIKTELVEKENFRRKRKKNKTK